MTRTVITSPTANGGQPVDGAAIDAAVEEKRPLLERLGALVSAAEGPHEWRNVQVPYTGRSLGRVPLAVEDDVERAARVAREAQPGWAARSFRERARVLLRFHDLLFEHDEELLDLIQLESGKNRRGALEEVLDTALVARHYAIHGPGYLRPRRRRGALPLLTRTRVLHHPVGLVGFISPWNYPLVLSITDLLAALMAGNAALLRPDLQGPFTALRAVDLLHEAGLPTGLVQVVTGEGSVAGPAVIDRVDYVMFTGSARVGRVVARQAAERLVGCSLELGGKNPALVLDDADVEAAAEGVMRGTFAGAGQLCVAFERVYVDRRIHDRFTSLLLERVGRMTLGGSLAYGPDMGSLGHERQLAAVRAHVDDALERGARLLAGGRHRPDIGPLFHEPTVLAGVTPGMEAYAEETFGPVVSLYPFDDVEEAVVAANDSRYGLSASVWSGNARRARDVAARIRTGTVNVNEGYGAAWASTAAPIGGMKESGIGRRHGREGIVKYADVQTVSEQRLIPLAPPPGIAEKTSSRVFSRVVRWMRHLPGLR